MSFPSRRTLPTPHDAVAYIDRFVRSQEQAKRDFAVTVYGWQGCRL